MKIIWTLAQDTYGNYYLKRHQNATGSPMQQVCRVSDALRVLGRSRRQIYRYFEKGILHPAGKFLGEWFIPSLRLKELLYFKKALRRPPSYFGILFPEYSLKDMNSYRDWRLIISRTLDLGDRKQVGWLLKHYPKKLIQKMIVEDGWRLLSPKSMRLWCFYFGIKLPEVFQWRRLGRPFGGMA